MKKLSILSCSILSCLCFFSCSNENLEENSYKVVQNKCIFEPVKVPTKSLEWDESFHPYDRYTRAVNHSNEMAVTTSNIFLGGVYTAESIQDLSFKWIQKPLEPIDVSYTFPRYFFDTIQRPSFSSMYRSLNKAVESPNFSGKQSLAFEYDFRQYSYYDELKLAFGANVNICSLLKLSTSVSNQKIRAKSGLFARIVQKNFSMIMDYPYDGNVFLNNDDLQIVNSQNPLYINSIIFGRMGIIAIESNYTYDELKFAFKAALTAKKVNGELEISSKHKKILQEATLKLFVSGGNGQDVAKIVEGYDEFKNFIINGGEFTRDVPGVPIFFTANHVSDNSVFTTTFEVAEQ